MSERQDNRCSLVRAGRRLRQFVRNPRFFLWAAENRIKGYKFGPIQRFRCCDHTTPFHYQACPQRDNSPSPVGGGES